MIHNFQLQPVRTQIPVTQVQSIPKFLHDHEIIAIQQMLEKAELLDGAIIGNQTDLNVIHRISQIKWLAWNDENWWLYTKVMEKVQELNQHLWKFDLYGVNEYLQYTEYQNINGNRGHYDWHIDVAHEGVTSNRKLSFECILDDHHEGGEFSLLMGPIEHKFKLNRGDAIIYPSFLLNKVYPVVAGKRSSIVSWISGPSFR